MKRIVQMIPSHHARDAAGAEAQYIEALFRAYGWQIDTYADNIDEELQGKTRHSSELRIDDPGNTIALYHFAVASVMSRQYEELPCQKAMIYHNVTPAAFFQPYDAGIADACARGREEMQRLASSTDLAIAHSDYSRRELEAAGYPVTRTIPFLLSRDRTEIDPDAQFIRRLGDIPNVLFVGRMAPNKCPDDFIRVAAAYHNRDRAPLRFLLVGKRHVLPPYSREIDQLLQEVNLSPEQLLVTDEVSDEELMACFKSSRLYLSMSRHEGFCVPLLEAMRFDLPVMARAEAAVPETIGSAGVLFNTSDHRQIADSVELLINDEEWLNVLVERGRKRLEHFDVDKWSFVFKVLMQQFAAA